MKISEYVLVALIGFGGVLLGALINAVTTWITARQARAEQKKLDDARKALLTTMLNDPKFTWRALDTLKHVIGGDDATAIRLLLELGARGSEDGKQLWGLISRNAFPDRQ